MAKRIKFALEMKDGMQVRSLEDLREHFDLDKTIGYFVDGKLLKWLEDRYYDEEAEAISALSKDDRDFNSKICKILDVKYEDEDLPEIDPEKIERRNERIAKLKQYTADTKILDKVDLVAFDQEELADLLDKEEPVIYLYQNKFTIPLREKNKKYIGIGKVEVVIRSKKKVDFDELNIHFENVQFNAEYEKLIKVMPDEFLKQGQQAEKAQDFDKALDFYQQAANAGMSVAMYNMAFVYERQQNYSAAIEWYRKALYYINDDDGDISFRLACCYRNIRDYNNAFKYMKTAANHGHADAMTVLGNIYYTGFGVNVNKQKALELYKKAAEKGNDSAIKTLEKIKNQSNTTSSDGCFITTAVCDSFHKPDNCYELTMFRAFRDNWLKKQSDGKELIAKYYAIAPEIVNNINKFADADKIYLNIWRKYLKPCLSYIEQGKNEQCKSVYMQMVNDLYKKFIN